MSNMQELIPYFADLIKKHKVYQDAFIELDNKAREHGFTLYWDDETERFSLSPLPRLLEEASKTKQEEPQKPARKIIAKVARINLALLTSFPARTYWEVDYIFDNCRHLLNWKDEWGARPLSGNTIEIEYDEPGVIAHARVLHGGLV